MKKHDPKWIKRWIPGGMQVLCSVCGLPARSSKDMPHEDRIVYRAIHTSIRLPARVMELAA